LQRESARHFSLAQAWGPARRVVEELPRQPAVAQRAGLRQPPALPWLLALQPLLAAAR